MPSWAKNADEFFTAADEFEQAGKLKTFTRRDGEKYDKIVGAGRAYKELEVAIPREAKDPVKWAKDFARESIGNLHPYRMAVHDKEATDGGRNVHMHLMFSTRTLDAYDRPKEKFFKDAARNYRHSKTKELVMADPAKGGAKKSEYWNSMKAIEDHSNRFVRHVQRAVPDFKLIRSDAPEQKIGPKLKKAGAEYAKDREDRAENVTELRAVKKERAEVDKEITKELEREKEQEKPKSRTDDLWAKLEGKSTPGKEAQQRPSDVPSWHDFLKEKKAGQRQKDIEPSPVEKQAEKPDWDRFKGIAGSAGTKDAPPPKQSNDTQSWHDFLAKKKDEQRQKDIEPPPVEKQAEKPDWSRFKGIAGSVGAKDAPPPPAPASKPDLSRFRKDSFAYNRKKEEPAAPNKEQDTNRRKDDKMMNDLPQGPGYFSESKQERAERDDEGALNQRRLEQAEQKQPEQDKDRDTSREVSKSDDLWSRLERETKEREDKARDKDRDDDMGYDR